ncbi:restriction endonuclease [Bacillus wiedmannii]|uniref:restriction endonuclease subunit S n=1 Tax=Bacillus wiedmannii TaxID=1890302 RepID=UPI000BF5A602|nr:restriction endonuclease subunit S [Bacillus wiedmannii]PGD79771.1 restriction endonuclease [Bacillus wiedmannii]
MARKMKYSGTEWIGNIPKEWKVTKVGNVKDRTHHYPIGDGDHGSIKPQDYSSKGVPYIRVQNLSWGKNINFDNMVYISSDVHSRNKKSVLLPGDILIAKTGATYGKTAIIPETINEANTTSSVGKITVDKNKFDNNYIYYALKSDSTYTEMSIVASQKSAQPGFNIEDFVEFKIPVPPREEQKKIGEFLDEKVSLIDNIIEDTKQSIEDLKQYKQSMITESVTKGLNKKAEMKDSRIDWIGEYPSHWDVNKINRLFEIKKDIANENGYDVLSVTQKGLKVKDITKNEGQMAADYSKYQIVNEDDFVMNHMDLLTGWVDCSIYEGVTSPDYRVFKNRNYMVANNTYYKYVFQTCYTKKIFYGLGQGVSNLGRWRLQTDKFINFYLPIPPLEEQEAISQFLIARESEINGVIEEKQKLISEFESYKKSMIYEYVTGKKEVL